MKQSHNVKSEYYNDIASGAKSALAMTLFLLPWVKRIGQTFTNKVVNRNG
jgi:hypothetical protein